MYLGKRFFFNVAGAPGGLLRLSFGRKLLVQHADHLHQAVVPRLERIAPDLVRELGPEKAQQDTI